MMIHLYLNRSIKVLKTLKDRLNSKTKWLKAYTRDNPNMFRIPKISRLMIKHIDEHGFYVTSLFDRINDVV